MRKCLTDEGRPLGTGLQAQVPNCHKLLWSKALVMNAMVKRRDTDCVSGHWKDERKRIAGQSIETEQQATPEPETLSCSPAFVATTADAVSHPRSMFHDYRWNM